MSPQLAAMFAAHKTAVFGAAAAGVVGLALLQKKKTGTATAAPKAAAATTVPGALPAAAVVAPATGGGAYDSSSYDLYNALQPEIEQLMQTRGGSVTSAPTPVASTLFAPDRTGQYVSYGDGSLREVESDGSTYHLSLPEWSSIIQANGGTAPAVTAMQGNAPAEYSYVANLQNKIAGGTAG